jgi:hypothetical protein
MRPEIAALEAAVGTKLFHFKEPDDDLDDDQGTASSCWIMRNN